MNESATVPDDVTDRASASTRRALPPGTWLDEFEVGEVIAEGSASIVYAATDDTLAVPVVIAEYMPAQLAQRGDDLRVLPSSSAHDDVFALGLRAFIADSRVLARCDHPSLVRILRLRESNATAYRVMPRYTASSLLDVRRGMREPPDEQSLRNLLDALLGALDAFHRAGGFHGKVTPSNILLLGNERPLLLGPGSAGRAIAGDLLLAPEAISAPSFAPIEQLVESPDMPLGPSADLYALAGVARYWISGDLPPPAVGEPGSARRETLDAMVERLQRRWPHLRYAPWLIDALDGAWSIYRAGRPQSVTEMRVRMNAALHDDLGRMEAQIPPVAARPGAVMEAQTGAAVAHTDDVVSARAPSPAPSTPFLQDAATTMLSDAASDLGREYRVADSPADVLSQAAPAQESVASSASDPAAHIDDPVVDVTLEPEDYARLDIRAEPVAIDAVAFDLPDSLVFDASDSERIDRPPRQKSGVAWTLMWMFAVFALLALAAGGVYVLNKQHRLDRVLDVLGISHPSSARAPPEPTAKSDKASAAGAPPAAPSAAPAAAIPPAAAAAPSATPTGTAAQPAAPGATTGGATVTSPAATPPPGGGTAASPVDSPAVAPTVVAPVPMPATVNPAPNAQTAAPNAQTVAPNAPADQPAGASNAQVNTQPNTQAPPAARASPAAPRLARHPTEARPAAPAPRAVAREPPSPRDACGGRTEFALYRCMQTQCGSPQWASHPQCERLRQTDRVE